MAKLSKSWQGKKPSLCNSLKQFLARSIPLLSSQLLYFSPSLKTVLSLALSSCLVVIFGFSAHGGGSRTLLCAWVHDWGSGGGLLLACSEAVWRTRGLGCLFLFSALHGMQCVCLSWPVVSACIPVFRVSMAAGGVLFMPCGYLLSAPHQRCV